MRVPQELGLYYQCKEIENGDQWRSSRDSYEERRRDIVHRS